jgi:hypothetical protein
VGGGRARLVAGEDGAQEEETLSWAGIGGVGGYEEVSVCGEVASFLLPKVRREVGGGPWWRRVRC